MASFWERTSAPSTGDSNFTNTNYGGNSPCILGSPTWWSGSTLSNCTGYAYGRWLEMGVSRSELDARGMANSPSYIMRTKSAYISSTPNRGAAVLFTQPVAAADTGHIAIVENYDGTYIYCSESNYGRSVSSGYGWRRVTYNRSSAYGYLQFPGESPDPGPTPGPTPTTTYTARAMCDLDPSIAYAKVALVPKDTWDWRYLDYKDSVTWTSSDSSYDYEHWLVWQAFYVGGNDEDGHPKAEFGYWNDLYSDRYRYWDCCPPYDVNYTAYFYTYSWFYHYDEGSSGPGHVEAGFSPTDTSATFKWRPHYHQDDTIYKVPKPDDGCVFRGWDASSTDMAAYKTVPGSTEADIYSMAYFASKINPTTWQFTDDTYYDKRKWITNCTCTCNGLVTGRVSTNVKIGLYVDDQLVATGEAGTLIWSGLVVTATNNVKIKALEASDTSYFLDLNLTSFKLSYYIYEKDDTGLGETRYLCTRYFDGTKWTDWTEQVV